MFTKFTKATLISRDALKSIKESLLKSKWTLTDDALSSFKAKQLYVTIQSSLNPQTAYMNSNAQNILDARFRKGEVIPYGYSLIYCNPLSSEFELSSDGYDNYHAPTFNLQDFFTRRMWVGGEFNYNLDNPLRFGDNVAFEESVWNFKSIRDSIFIDYKRVFNNENGMSLIEKRRLCYLNKLFEMSDSINETIEEGDKSIIVMPSEITNFRMSSLTFNSHLIHYDPSYTSIIEKYPRIVIQAPLLFQLLLSFWNDDFPQTKIERIKYKVTKPCFINDKLSLNYKRTSETEYKLWIRNLSCHNYLCFESILKMRK